MTRTVSKTQRQPTWFLLLFALAAAGGAVAYVPLLTVLLPVKITALQGVEDVSALARVTFFGAIIASLANIAFGMLSDRSRNRIPWIVAGLISSSVLLIAIGYARSMTELIILVMTWQIGLNMMLGPLLSWAGDCFPDAQKGMLGGALSLAPALGAIAGSLVTLELLIDEQYRLWMVAALVCVLVSPAIIFGRHQTRPPLLLPRNDARDDDTLIDHGQSTVIRMWAARFLVQIAEAGLFAFLLFWLRSVAEDVHENSAANIFSMVLIVSVPLSLILGRWSDRNDRPILPLALCAMFTAAGLAVMAIAENLTIAISGYVLFGIAASIFLSLHTGQTLRVLPKPQHRGRDMGIFNLTNTVPSIIMPWLTISLVPAFGFTALFALFAGFAAMAALLLATIAVRR